MPSFLRIIAKSADWGGDQLPYFDFEVSVMLQFSTSFLPENEFNLKTRRFWESKNKILLTFKYTGYL